MFKLRQENFLPNNTTLKQRRSILITSRENTGTKVSGTTQDADSVLMAPKFHGDAILSGINPVDGKLSHSSRSFPRSVCNILQIHYERRASARKVYRVIHGQACPKCTRNIPVVECISMQSSAIKVKNFPFKVSVKFYRPLYTRGRRANERCAIADFASLRCRQRSRLSAFHANYVAIHIWRAVNTYWKLDSSQF